MYYNNRLRVILRNNQLGSFENYKHKLIGLYHDKGSEIRENNKSTSSPIPLSAHRLL